METSFPCLICNEEHFTRDSPHREEVNQFLKYSTSPIMLTDPFPNQETHLIAWDPTSSNLVLMIYFAKLETDIMVATRNKYYGNVNPSNG